MNEAVKDLKPYLAKAYRLIADAGRPMSLSEITEAGINRMTLSQLASEGLVDRPVRGVYHVPREDDDQRVFWAAVSLGYDAVFCLTSAASFYGLTEESAGIPDVAIPLKARVPSNRSLEIRVRFHHWPDAARSTDVDLIDIQGVQVRVTSPARTVVDMFRHSTLNDEHGFRPSIQDSTFVDCLSRYLEVGDQNFKSAELRRVASEHGCWDRIHEISSVIMITKDRHTPH